jgi:hypothetical protein
MTETVVIEKPRGMKKKGTYTQFVLYVYNQLKTLNKKMTQISNYIEKEKVKEHIKKVIKEDDEEEFI